MGFLYLIPAFCIRTMATGPDPMSPRELAAPYLHALTSSQSFRWSKTGRKDCVIQRFIIESSLPLKHRQTRTLRVIHFAQHKPAVSADSSCYTILNYFGSFLLPLESKQSFSGIARCGLWMMVQMKVLLKV